MFVAEASFVTVTLAMLLPNMCGLITPVPVSSVPQMVLDNADLGGCRWPETVSIIFRQFLQPIVESFQIPAAEFGVGFQIVAFSPLVP